ncbi:MAG: hypothetical protein GX754_03785 [Clostridiaceae bacterium]|nr:hypothetical protein [Clostridiaceae bacterium]
MIKGHADTPVLEKAEPEKAKAAKAEAAKTESWNIGFENAGIYDLIGSYKNYYRDLHNKNVTDYFDSLVELSKIDIEQNRKTNSKIREMSKRINLLDRQIRKRAAVKVLLIVLTVIAALVVAGQISAMFQAQAGPELLQVLIALAGAALGGLFIYLIIKFNPKTKELKAEKSRLEEKARNLTSEAWEQMRPLNELFTSKMSPELFRKTMPYINLDKMFDRKRLDYFVSKFGLSETRGDNRSALFVQSGDINGNPFFICTDLVHELGTKTYTGSITIHWTTTHYSNGKRVTRHHTQVLTASVEKPCPYYKEETYLVYGNEAAPDLIFSRRDSDAEHMNQKQIDRHVNRKIKKLRKRAEKNVVKGGEFTVLGNSEFEVLFGAADRNNEVQFRLLFTPLAQKQLLEIMKEKEIGFGDDFSFIKHRMLNYIYPQHLHNFNLNVAPGYFHGFDFDDVRSRFINYNNDYFRHLYFTFATILAIPLYQQHKPREFIYKDLYDSFASFYEHEYVANNMNAVVKTLAHPMSATPSILKTIVVSSGGKSDTVRVNAFGYRTEEKVDYVKKLGGDGKIHTIPVHWIKYIPVVKATDIVVNALDVAEETSYTEKFRQAVKNIKDRKKIGEKDIYRVGAFLSYIIKD